MADKALFIVFFADHRCAVKISGSNRNAIGTSPGCAVMPHTGVVLTSGEVDRDSRVGSGATIIILGDERGRVVWTE
jgi:hypothetical protein